jgi:aspartate/glutamate racemase
MPFQELEKALGGLHSAKIVLYSVDFDPVEKLMGRGDWQGVAEDLSEAAVKIQSAGADFLLICTEIGMLVDQKDTPVKLFDTTAIHAQKAVQCAYL